MKHTLVFLCLLIAFAAQGQNKRQASRVIDRLEEEQWEIILPIEERVPKNTRKATSAAASTNWGVALLLPDDLKARLVAECTHRVVLKILDTGGKQTHHALQQGQLTGSNFTNTPTLNDIQGHGTHVAGIAVGDGLGLLDALVDKGLVTWKPIKVLDDEGSGMFSWIGRAVDAESAEDKRLLTSGSGVVYSGSLSGSVRSTTLDGAMKTATEQGVLFFYAAGNTGKPGVQYPANSAYAIACGAINKTMKKASFSSTGPEVNNAMPGDGINSTWKDNQYASLSGTSMATPFLSAAACIALSKWGPALIDVTLMRRYLAWCASDLDTPGKDDNTGWGVVYVRSILDKDPAKIPPVIVPGDVPKDTFFREERVLNFTMPGKYDFTWTKGVPKGKMFVPKEGQTMRYESKKDLRALAGGGKESVKITRLEVAVKTNLEAGMTYRQAAKVVSDYFQNRGLILGVNNDYADATRQIAYFLDKQFWDGHKTDVQVILIEGADPAGNTVFFDRVNGLDFKVGSPIIIPPK